MRAAVIGIGSNSLRMLIAEVENGALRRLLRDREGLRIFAALDEQGNISREMTDKACESVSAMAQRAKEYGCDSIFLFATSAVRDATNQSAFCDALKKATGLTLEVCPGEEEAILSFLGATSGRPSGLIDIGGGSTEIVRGEGQRIDFAYSFQMGAVRLFRVHPIASVEDVKTVATLSERILQEQSKAFNDLRAMREWVGVGGTFTTMAALVQNISWTDRQHIHGFSATYQDVERVAYELAPLSLPQRLQMQGLQPQRADIVVHGLSILLGCMRTLSIERIIVSEYGNLEGYLKRKYCD